jgi:hypothetical protein
MERVPCQHILSRRRIARGFFAVDKCVAVTQIDKSHCFGVSFLWINLAITAPKRATPYALSEFNSADSRRQNRQMWRTQSEKSIAPLTCPVVFALASVRTWLLP